MAIAITEEHQELARVARTFLADQRARAVARALIEAATEELPRFWKQLCELGWTACTCPRNTTAMVSRASAPPLHAQALEG